MANKSKKSNSIKQKTTVRKNTRKKSKKHSHTKKNIFIVFSVLLLISLISFGYFLGKNDREEIPQKSKEYSESTYSTKELLDDLSKIKTNMPKEKNTKKQEKIEYKEDFKALNNIETKTLVDQRGKKKDDGKIQVDKMVKKAKPKSKKKQNISLAYRGKKPRLVILIDDVHSKNQLHAIQNLGLKITPSVFPPYTLSPRSHLLARQVKHSMIHLPMESSSKQFNKQTKTLMTSFSDERIVDRVMELRRLFPHVKYVNNHTGSVFTSNYKAMKKLYIALRMEGFVFVDSFTVATSKVKMIAHEFGDAYVRRDIFIDNIHTIAAIHKQLKLAVQKAKKNGYAIAIGHPHKVTMQAIKSAQDIFKDIELVYLDDIYRRK